MIILKICQKQPFDIIAMTPRGTLGLCCVHIAQLVTHPAVYTLLFTLHLCYKPLCILERLIKSQKFHCKNFTTLTLLDIGPKVFSEWSQRNKNFLCSPLIFFKIIKNSFPEILEFIHHTKSGAGRKLGVPYQEPFSLVMKTFKFF